MGRLKGQGRETEEKGKTKGREREGKGKGKGKERESEGHFFNRERWLYSFGKNTETEPKLPVFRFVAVRTERKKNPFRRTP